MKTQRNHRLEQTREQKIASNDTRCWLRDSRVLITKIDRVSRIPAAAWKHYSPTFDDRLQEEVLADLGRQLEEVAAKIRFSNLAAAASVAS